MNKICPEVFSLRSFLRSVVIGNFPHCLVMRPVSKHLCNVLKHRVALRLSQRNNNQSAAFAVLNQIRMVINFTLQGPLLVIGS